MALITSSYVSQEDTEANKLVKDANEASSLLPLSLFLWVGFGHLKHETLCCLEKPKATLLSTSPIQ